MHGTRRVNIQLKTQVIFLFFNGMLLSVIVMEFVKLERVSELTFCAKNHGSFIWAQFSYVKMMYSICGRC